MTSYTVKALQPFTLYNISMKSVNDFGESLPSYSLRVLTHTENEVEWSKATPDGNAVPKLPDSMACCRGKNITHQK